MAKEKTQLKKLEVTKDTFTRNTVLDARLELNKMEDTLCSSLNLMWILVGVLLFFIIGGIMLIAFEAILLGMAWITIIVLGIVGTIYYIKNKKNFYHQEFNECYSKLEKVNTYEEFVDLKEWFITDKRKLLKEFNKLNRSNDLAKGLIIGGLLF